MTHSIAVIGGDGIGPEVVAVALDVVRAAGVALDTTDFDLGGARYLRDGTILPDDVLDQLTAANTDFTVFRGGEVVGTAWEARVTPRHDSNELCAQAWDWLATVGPTLPGSVEEAEKPQRETVVRNCKRAVSDARNPPGSASTDSVGGWGSREDGLDYGAFAWSATDSKKRTLFLVVAVRPASS